MQLNYFSFDTFTRSTYFEYSNIDLNDEKLSNLDYLQMILQKELEIRARQKQIKLRRASKLPNKVFELSNLNKGLEWQIKQLSHLMWLNEEQNVILLGKCGTGKTSLAVHLGETVIDNGHKTYYTSIDTFVSICREQRYKPKSRSNLLLYAGMRLDYY